MSTTSSLNDWGQHRGEKPYDMTDVCYNLHAKMSVLRNPAKTA